MKFLAALLLTATSAFAAEQADVAYQSLRMEPVFMALGESCGIAAMKATTSGTTLRAVDVKSV